MTVTYYSWDDVGAPQITAGGDYTNNIIEVMDAILINGYGSKPGLGWTKEMTSEVEGSDRTVYKNKSAHQDDMHLLVQSHPTDVHGFMMQIADSVTSPEIYSGYSQVGACSQAHDSRRWHAVGDERTFIFIYYSSFIDRIHSGYWQGYSPYCFYVGDFDSVAGSHPKGWGLMCPAMVEGTLDTVTPSGSAYGTFNISYDSSIASKTTRPVTQVPGEIWSESDVYGYCFSLESRPSYSSVEIPYREISDFEANVQVRSPWFYLLNLTHLYKFRGVYNFFPWLAAGNSDNYRNWCKTVTVDGMDYLPLLYKGLNGSNIPMTVYIQTSGEW